MLQAAVKAAARGGAGRRHTGHTNPVNGVLVGGVILDVALWRGACVGSPDGLIEKDVEGGVEGLAGQALGQGGGGAPGSGGHPERGAGK